MAGRLKMGKGFIDYAKSTEISDKIMQVSKYYDGYKRKGFIAAMLLLFKNDEYSHTRFIKKLSKQSERMTHQADKWGFLKLIESIYNYKASGDNRVRLYSY